MGNGTLVDFCKMHADGLVEDCEEQILLAEAGGIDALQALDDIWYASKQIELFRSVISHYRRQLIYLHVTETGRGSGVELGKRYKVAKQRISELAAEAKVERLARVTGESIVREASAQSSL